MKDVQEGFDLAIAKVSSVGGASYAGAAKARVSCFGVVPNAVSS